jgi:site-specific recombinase XerD
MLRLELCGILPHGKDTLLTQIADDDIVEEYKEICQTDYNLLPQSIDHRLTCLNVMFKQAKKKQHFDGKYVCEKFNVKFGNTLYLKDHEVKEIQDRFEKMGKPEHRDCVIALVNLGCRQDDLWRITERDVDMNRPDPKVYIHASKDGIDRNLTIPQQLLPIIKQRLTGNPKMKLFPYSNSWMLGGWNRVRELMGHAKEKGWSPHVLRHTVGSRLAMANMSPQYIQQYLGHKSIQATFRYMHLAPKTTDACVDVINQINGDTTPVTHINKSTGDVEQLQLSEQQLQQVANFIVKLTAKPNGDLPNRHQVTKATQFISTDSKSVT